MRVSFADQSKSFASSARRVHIKAWDYLLIIGFCFAPMTGFRTGKVGPGEVLCLLWCTKSIIRFRVTNSETFRFILGFLLALVLGSMVGSFVAPRELILKQFYTWIYLGGIAVLTYEMLIQNSYEYNEKLMLVLICAGVIWQLYLYEYSQNVSRRFYGAPLWYGGVRYSGGGTNPHQVAFTLCALQFLLLRRILQKKSIIICATLSWFCYFIMRETESSTGVVSLVLGALCFLYLWVGSKGSKNAYIFILLTFAIAMFALLFYSKVYSFVMDWIHEDSNGQGRLWLYSRIGVSFSKSPIFGLGPGTHIGGRIEYHNTYLEIIAATGLLGSFLFVLYTVRIVKKLYRTDWSLIPAVVAIYGYGTAGFAMRRLVYWIILAMILALAETKARHDLLIGAP